MNIIPRGCESVLHNLFFYTRLLLTGKLLFRVSLVAFTFILTCVRAYSIGAQTLQPQDDIQSWNDVQLTVPMTKHFDFQTQVTGRFGKNITRLNDARYQIGFVSEFADT